METWRSVEKSIMLFLWQTFRSRLQSGSSVSSKEIGMLFPMALHVSMVSSEQECRVFLLLSYSKVLPLLFAFANRDSDRGTNCERSQEVRYEPLAGFNVGECRDEIFAGR